MIASGDLSCIGDDDDGRNYDYEYEACKERASKMQTRITLLAIVVFGGMAGHQWYYSQSKHKVKSVVSQAAPFQLVE